MPTVNPADPTPDPVQIELVDEDDTLALYCHYEGQSEPQPCYVRLSLELGRLYAGFSGEISSTSMPESVWHGRTLEWAVPCLTPKAANQLLQELMPLAAQVLAGADVEWDGHNHIGRLTDAAAVVAQQIRERCNPTEVDWWRGDLVEEMNAAEWFVYTNDPLADLGLTADTTDEQLAAKAKEVTEEAMTIAEGPTVLLGAYEHLKRLRDEARGGD